MAGGCYAGRFKALRCVLECDRLPAFKQGNDEQRVVVRVRAVFGRLQRRHLDSECFAIRVGRAHRYNAARKSPGWQLAVDSQLSATYPSSESPVPWVAQD